MTNTRAARLGAAMAVAWLIVLTVLDLVAPPNISPDPLFAIAPLAAAAVMSARVTAGFATATVALVALSGLYNDRWTTTQQWVRLLNVVLVGAAVVTLAVVRIFRRERFRRIRSIAEAAQRAVLPTLPDAAAGVRVVAARYQRCCGGRHRGWRPLRLLARRRRSGS